MAKSLFIISGEASGDMHGAHLVRELKDRHHDLTIHAWGGDLMESSGAVILKHYRDLAFMGFYEVIKNLPEILRNFNRVKEQIQKVQPDLVLLIDYPGFNLKLLPWLKEQGYPIIYYIAPQAWAWKERRVKAMAQYIDELFVILPFEEKFFRERNVKTQFVGHPLLQSIPANLPEKKSKQIALLPGSRRQEIDSILPAMLEMVNRFPFCEFVIAGMSYLGHSYYQNIIGEKRATIIMDASTEVIARSQLALVSSGTATLQTALLSTPLIVCYRTGWLNYQLAKRLIKVKYISLVNLILDEPVIPELIQGDLTPSRLESLISSLLGGNERSVMLKKLESLKLVLGEKNASKTSADIISKYLTSIPS